MCHSVSFADFQGWWCWRHWAAGCGGIRHAVRMRSRSHAARRARGRSGGPWPLRRQSARCRRARREMQLSFAPLVKRSRRRWSTSMPPSTEQAFQSPFASDPFFSQLFGGDSPCSRAGRRTSQSLGSGVIVDPKGVILTNRTSSTAPTRSASRSRMAANIRSKLVLDDPRSDLAVLQIRDAKRPDFPGAELCQFRRSAGGRSGARHRQSVRGGPDGDQRHRFGAGADRGRDRQFRLSSSRPMRRSIRAIRVAHWSTCEGRLVGINTAIFTPVRRLGRHRLCHPGQHGARMVADAGMKGGADRAALVRRAAAGGDDRHRRQPRHRSAAWGACHRGGARTARRQRPGSSRAT